MKRCSGWLWRRTVGWSAAQLYLGDLHESGTGVPADPERARRYYGLCASRENPECQVRLARLLLALPNRRERDYLQAIAWIQLAADRGNPAARALAEKESPQLTSEQVEWVNRLKVQLVHRQ